MTNFDKVSLLNIYATKPLVKKALLEAYEIEQKMLKGIEVREASILKAKINTESGFWEMELNVDHGKVFYKFLDLEMTLLEMITVPSKEYLKNKDLYSAEEAEHFLNTDLCNTYYVDLKDIDSVKDLKVNVQDDFVLKNTRFDEKYNAANQIILNFKIWRKYFMNYTNNFGFLWEDTDFKSASDLCFNMKKLSLL
ncbi:MAG: hypothetical protein KGO93_04120 [Cyanobacteria bacterium REEB446]|nr:hypothetical protein [Cyanobacteria bacterium REEB446]